MKTVFKYLINERPIEIPACAKFLHFGIQNGSPFAWFEVNTDAKKVLRNLTIYGTGQEIPFAVGHLASIQDGTFVWHLYEALK